MNWDESKHPRVPGGKVNGGQFTDSEVGAAVDAARQGAQLPSLDECVLSEAEKIADLEKERLVIMNEDGTVLRRIDGNENQVETDVILDRQAAEAGVMLHNHPGGSQYTRFSLGDLGYMVKVKAKHFSIVAGDYVLTLKPDWEAIHATQGQYLSYPFIKNVIEGNVIDRVTEAFRVQFSKIKAIDVKSDYWTAVEAVDRAKGYWTDGSYLATEDFVINAIVEGYRDSGLRPTLTKWR